MCVKNNTLFQTNQASVSGENEGWGGGREGGTGFKCMPSLFSTISRRTRAVRKLLENSRQNESKVTCFSKDT